MGLIHIPQPHHSPCADMQRTARYAFGGTQEHPLVDRTVTYTVTEADLEDNADAKEACRLQLVDAVLADVCAVFDEAIAAFDGGADAAGTALDVFVGAAVYGTGVACAMASAKYLLLFTRV